jgi:hypothetical protein
MLFHNSANCYVCIVRMNQYAALVGRQWQGENQSTHRKTYTNATLSITNPTKTGPCLLGVRPATNCLSRKTAVCPRLFVTVWKQSYVYRKQEQLVFGSQRVSKRLPEHAFFPVKIVTILLISVQYKQQECSKLLDYKSLENTERPGSARMDYLQRSKWGRSHNVTCPVSVKLLCIWQTILL